MVRGFRHDERPGDAWPHDDEKGKIMPEDITPPYRDRSHRAMVARMDRQRRESAQVDPGRAERLARHEARLALARETRTDVFDPPPWMAEPGAERFGGEPPVGTVLRWEDHGVPYVALRLASRWEIGGDEGDAIVWATVARLIGDNPCQVAVGWREIPAPEPEPSGDDAVRDWAARFLPDSTVPDGPSRTVDALVPDGQGGYRKIGTHWTDQGTVTERDISEYRADRDVDARTAPRDEPERGPITSAMRSEAPGPMTDTRPAGERD